MRDDIIRNAADLDQLKALERDFWISRGADAMWNAAERLKAISEAIGDGDVDMKLAMRSYSVQIKTWWAEAFGNTGGGQ